MYDCKSNEKLAKYSIFSEQNHFYMPKKHNNVKQKGAYSSEHRTYLF